GREAVALGAAGIAAGARGLRWRRTALRGTAPEPAVERNRGVARQLVQLVCTVTIVLVGHDRSSATWNATGDTPRPGPQLNRFPSTGRLPLTRPRSPLQLHLAVDLLLAVPLRQRRRVALE